MGMTKGTVGVSPSNARKMIDALPVMLSDDAVVFDLETTGLSSRWDEIVSFAVKSPTRPVELNSLIMPKRPKQLLKVGKNGTCAYDVSGIHPDHLIGSPTFEELYPRLRAVLEGKHWVCWNAEFDVEFLDSICDRRKVEPIPRASVLCAMQLLSPLAGLREQRRGRVHNIVLSDTADERIR